MSTATDSARAGSRPRRADAERSIQAILDAALVALAEDPDTSMAEIARRAGVVRATVYVHFPTREALIDAITERAVREAIATLRSADPKEGEPTEALARLLSASWTVLGRYHALVTLNSRRGSEQMRAIHQRIMRLVRPLFKRGQASGAFNASLSVDWMETVVLELIHAASRDVTAGRLPERKAEETLITTVTAALSSPPAARRTSTGRSPMSSQTASRSS